LSSRFQIGRAKSVARRKNRHETFPSVSGSTNTVGQALEQLYSRTSDAAPPKRYDLFGGTRRTNSSFRPLGKPENREPSIGLDGSTYIRGRGSTIFRLERFTLSDATPRPAAVVSFVCDTFFATYPASLAWKATIHK
jgi:hypothetical protein